jgi:hypothetical protein
MKVEIKNKSKTYKRLKTKITNKKIRINIQIFPTKRGLLSWDFKCQTQISRKKREKRDKQKKKECQRQSRWNLATCVISLKRWCQNDLNAIVEGGCHALMCGTTFF